VPNPGLVRRNSQAAARRNGNPTRGQLELCAENRAACSAAFKIPCKPGYVWREAVPGDYVCVAPEVRDQVQADNAAARRRRRDYEAIVR